MIASAPLINDRREIFGWMVYDWANSAFYTTVGTALLGPYLTALAQSVVGDNGIIASFGPLGSMTAKSFFPFCVSISVFLQVFLLPVLGGIADYSTYKRRMMAFFCYAGVAATCLLFFITQSVYLVGGLLYIFANLSFGAANVLYNSYLPDIATGGQARPRFEPRLRFRLPRRWNSFSREPRISLCRSSTGSFARNGRSPVFAFGRRLVGRLRFNHV
ncbi:MAG: MFS transporter [Pyrinomonadaceae bacterium]